MRNADTRLRSKERTRKQKFPMKHPNPCLALVAFATFATGGLSIASAQSSSSRDLVVITPPAVRDGSNGSRAPFPASRPFDDVKAPDGHAIDVNVPPNTPATGLEPNALPPPAVAVIQPAPTTTTIVEPGVAPTGRTSTSVAMPLAATQTATALNSADFRNRELILADVDARLNASDNALRTVRASATQMSAASSTQFRTVDEDVTRAERALRESLRAARAASEQQWDAARARLSSDFQTYAAALTRLDAAAGVAPAMP